MSMLWNLRLFWYRLDKAAFACALFFAFVVGVLATAAAAVFNHRDAQHAAVRQFHARSVDCLARNVYYEARGESLAGQYAVAEVTMNRKASPRYPKTVCEVVYQKSAFSWTEDDVDAPVGAEWRRAAQIAEDVYYQRRPPALPGVLHYHATYVRPDWSKERERVARIGRHVFYR
ncbi:MAG: cell wall hydrolase [Betaproteobacteria bacterium]|nr:MAG: cell wall hydrolase [Betaproteobacteria bacterium]